MRFRNETQQHPKTAGFEQPLAQVPAEVAVADHDGVFGAHQVTRPTAHTTGPQAWCTFSEGIRWRQDLMLPRRGGWSEAARRADRSSISSGLPDGEACPVNGAAINEGEHWPISLGTKPTLAGLTRCSKPRRVIRSMSPRCGTAASSPGRVEASRQRFGYAVSRQHR